MITATSKSQTDYPIMEAGNFPARCYSMIHTGTAEENIMGEMKLLNKVRISFEFPTETKAFKEGEHEKPYVISKEYTLSMSEKANLRKMMESWRGKAYNDTEAESVDITKMLGVACLLNVIHKETKAGKKYADIGSVSPLPKGFECPAQINATFEFNFEDKFDLQKLEAMPDFLKERIKKSKEFLQRTNPQEQHVGNGSNPPEDFFNNEPEYSDSLPF